MGDHSRQMETSLGLEKHMNRYFWTGLSFVEIFWKSGNQLYLKNTYNLVSGFCILHWKKKMDARLPHSTISFRVFFSWITTNFCYNDINITVSTLKPSHLSTKVFSISSKLNSRLPSGTHQPNLQNNQYQRNKHSSIITLKRCHQSKLITKKFRNEAQWLSVRDDWLSGLTPHRCYSDE